MESNAELKSFIISMHSALPTKARDEVVEASTSFFADAKFGEDILAVVDNHNAGDSSLEDKSIYEDPITTNLMIDPIVASDGNTYCRWTIIDNNLTTNPSNMDEVLTIVIDNLTFQRSLFEKFPKQAQIFQQRRNQHRSHAFSLKAKGLWGDAILALQYVLHWDKYDVECFEALEQVQGALEETKEKYLLSNELSSGRSIGTNMHKMEVQTTIELRKAYKFFSNLSSSTPEVQQMATYGICQWTGRDVKFQSYIIKQGGISLLAKLLPSSDRITQEHLVSILLDLSQSSYKHQTLFGKVIPDFPDALEPISEILKDGSTKARKQAAKIFLNLSMSDNKKSIIESSVTILALVTSLSNGTPQVQQIAIDILNNLFPDALESIAKILKEGSIEASEQAARVFFNLSMSGDRRNIIESSMSMLALVTSLSDKTPQVQQIVSNTLNNLFPDALEPISEILKDGSTKAREQATKIFLNLSTSDNRKSIIESSMTMLALVTSFSNGTPQVQQIATDILNNLFPDALEPIAKILKEGSIEANEQAAKIFLDLSTSDNRKSIIESSMSMLALVTSLSDKTPQVQQIVSNTLNNLFLDALESFAEILKEGSTNVREQAAKILFNLSTSHDRSSVIGNSGAMRALVTSLGDGTLQIQQIVASTLSNLCHHYENEIQTIEAGLVPILLKLTVEQPTTMLEEALPLVDELLNF